MKPPKLRKGDIDNYNTLLKAFGYGDIALVSAIRKADQKPVALLCAMQENKDNTLSPIPFAVMIEDNPFEIYEDPTIL